MEIKGLKLQEARPGPIYRPKGAGCSTPCWLLGSEVRASTLALLSLYVANKKLRDERSEKN